MDNLKILFVIATNRLRKDNKAPLYCRITYKGKRKQFSIGIFIDIKTWNNKQQRVKPPDKNLLNSRISLIKQQINQAFLFLQVSKKDFDVEDVFLKYKGKEKTSNKSVLELFKEHNEKAEKLIGKEYVLPTIWKFKQSRNLLKDFIKFQFKKNDYQFKDLNLQFIKNYEFYLKTEKNLAQSTTYKVIQRFRKIIKIAIAESYLDKDPFIMYKIKRPKAKIIYLTTEELKLLEDFTFSQIKLEKVKDLFMFCCYTGLAFKEMENLDKSHIVTGFDGCKWIKMNRVKTDKPVSIPLLSKALRIIEKYQNDDGVLPKITNQKFNSYIKEVAEIVGIEKKLTHHIARKTFATTILLYNDVPMEIVSELLGHSKISITQEHYAKVIQKKVSEQMKLVNKKIRKQRN